MLSFFGLPNNLLNKLQYIQNSAARVLTFSKKSSHIILVLCSLHWLPVTYRIQYKILLITFKALHRLAPQYLWSPSPLHSPRSSSIVLLLYPTLKCQHLEAGHSVLPPPNYWIFFLRISNISDFETKLFNKWFELIYLWFCVYFYYFLFFLVSILYCYILYILYCFFYFYLFPPTLLYFSIFVKRPWFSRKAL